jgi:hypothetical protein
MYKSGFVYVIIDTMVEGRLKIGCGYDLRQEIASANRWYFGTTQLAAHSGIFLDKTKGEALMHKLFAKYRIDPMHEGFVVDNLATLKEICATVTRAGDYAP